MNRVATQASGGRLTQEQRQILAHFNAMSDEAQRIMIGMAESIARGSPRSRPKLRLVAGGAA
ncbi:hypothetical protein [Massilia sp. TN1-12]|uniref:hypothetical protein n=1 Tax=Massilia paldalensis TaxID=3377675 RepID=UPI00384EAC23